MCDLNTCSLSLPNNNNKLNYTKTDLKWTLNLNLDRKCHLKRPKKLNIIDTKNVIRSTN